MPRTNVAELVGRRFGRLTVLGETLHRAVNGAVLWRCRCDCGAVRLVMTSNLTRRNTQSCGCLQREVSRRPNRERAS